MVKSTYAFMSLGWLSLVVQTIVLTVHITSFKYLITSKNNLQFLLAHLYCLLLAETDHSVHSYLFYQRHTFRKHNFSVLECFKENKATLNKTNMINKNT